MTSPAASLVIPAYEEGQRIVPVLDRIFGCVQSSIEVLVVYDTDDDSTAPVLSEYAESESRLQPTLNTYGRGPAHAIRYGIDMSSAPVVVVTMADGSDDPTDIDSLIRRVAEGAAIANASRYVRGGSQIGGPWIKGAMSRLAGVSLFYLAGVGTRDATNSFKAYDRRFVESVGIESIDGFELGLELVAKARRARLPVSEIPTTWRNRVGGESSFRIMRWIPKYLHWYLYAYGPARPVMEEEEVET